jgi:hypothetical protein
VQRDGQLEWTDIPKADLLRGPGLLITTGIPERHTLAVHPALGLNLGKPILGRRNPTEVFFDVLFSDVPDRDLVSFAVRDGQAKNPLTQENSLCVVAEGPMAEVGEERFRLVKPLVYGEIVLGLATELLDTILRMLQRMSHV